MRRLLVLTVLLLAAACAQAQVKLTTYTDPGGVFTWQVPDTWKATRAPMGQLGFDTTFSAAGEKVQIEIINLTSPQDLQPGQLQELATNFIGILAQQLQQTGTVSSSPTVADKLAGHAAVKQLLIVKDNGTGEETAVLVLVTLGKRNLVGVAVAAPQAEVAALQKGLTCWAP